MKIHGLLITASIFITSLVDAQPFEGLITYKIQYEVVEPNRTDLEIYKNMIPNEMKLFLKGPSSMLQFLGGMTEGILGDILYKTSDKVIYSIFPTTKTFTKTSIESLDHKSGKQLKAVKTDSIKSFSGIPCTKYVIKDTTEHTETALWCAKSINNPSSKIMGYFLESMTEISVAGIEGLPMKIEFYGKEFNLIIQSIGKEKKVIPATFFTVPKTYKLSKADPQLH
ncbi:MAG: DUF4412 domain-containing protein [Opitutaceae bacterium]|nr:DUF4412 domain-containing protein [Cytophagales bacterium]